ncbi:hypothetical protein [Pseudothauera rhizosphaerae]|uniref:Uncharacterized protein n=1 Tax=Pseudothauera rhizosphaerae TaxID=2565932 RepID=A0A4V3WAI3_9RHOO|nr:hypothetical protein [Pseudothauera rhizosphaerae]THF59392.1 hypothetical protein E6O51_15480 [Pseudothauera rhizosphaerae]
MDRISLDLVEGDLRTPGAGHARHGGIQQAVNKAIRAGFHVGLRVRIGRVAGRIVGYNIGAYGRYGGARYPLLVDTRFGLAKCSLREVAAA